MDALLYNRDHALDARGFPAAVTGRDALIQRLLIRLGVRRGSFLPDPALGSRLHKLSAAGEEGDRLALHYAQQALLPEPEARVTAARCRLIPPDALAVTVSVEIGGQTCHLEVTTQ